MDGPHNHLSNPLLKDTATTPPIKKYLCFTKYVYVSMTCFVYYIQMSPFVFVLLHSISLFFPLFLFNVCQLLKCFLLFIQTLSFQFSSKLNIQVTLPWLPQTSSLWVSLIWLLFCFLISQIQFTFNVMFTFLLYNQINLGPSHFVSLLFDFLLHLILGGGQSRFWPYCGFIRYLFCHTVWLVNSVLPSGSWAASWTAAPVPLSLGILRHEYQNGCHSLLQAFIPNPGTKSGSPTLQTDCLVSHQEAFTHSINSLCVCIYISIPNSQFIPSLPPFHP